MSLRLLFQDFREFRTRLGLLVLKLAKSADRAGCDRSILMLRIIRDQHYGDAGRVGIGLKLANHLDAIGVIDVQLPIHQCEIKMPAFELRERALGIINLHDFTIEIAREIRADRSMIRTALTNIKNSLWHLHI